jgi:hypothetical protein
VIVMCSRTLVTGHNAIPPPLEHRALQIHAHTC